MQYTLDTNCIIDLEEKRNDYPFLLKMIEEYKKDNIDLAVVAISASENQKGGKPSDTFEEFESKLLAAGLEGINILLPMGYWDVAYWDHFLWDGDPELELKIHNILFPGTPIENPTNEGFSERKWRNYKCDVQIAWSHAFHKRDVLVTSDSDIHDNKEALAGVGVGKIIYPGQFMP